MTEPPAYREPLAARSEARIRAGQRLTKARRASGLTQQHLASRLGLRLIDVERLELGEADVTPHLESIAEQTGRAPSWFVEEAVDATPGDVERPDGQAVGRPQRAAAATAPGDRGLEAEEKERLEKRIRELETERDDASARLRAAEDRHEQIEAEARRIAERQAAEHDDALAQLRELQAARDDAVARLRTREQTLKAVETRAAEAEQRAAELAARLSVAAVDEPQPPLPEVDEEPRAAQPPVPEVDEEPAEAPPPVREVDEEPAPAAVKAASRVNLNAASFEELRGLGMSVTQSRRVIKYRERLDGYESVDDLDAVPGLPRALRAALKTKLEV